MIKANIIPIFNTDMTILLKICSFLCFFLCFFDQKIRAVKKPHLHRDFFAIVRFMIKLFV